MRQTGRTTKMLRKALRLARDHETVPILVPTFRIGRELLRMALTLLREQTENPGHEDYISGVDVNRLHFVSTGDLRGITTPPLLADHTWREHYADVFAAKELLDQAEGKA